MRYMLLIILFSFSLNAFAQNTLPAIKKNVVEWIGFKKDTVVIRDTVYKRDTSLLPIYETYDTSKKVLLQMSLFGFTRIRKGYQVLRGFCYVTGGRLSWAEEPLLHATLNRRKKPIKKVIQIL